MMGFLVRFASYNILAGSLCSNLKPWFWYGYSGIQQGQIYINDGLDNRRIEAFGLERSNEMINVWSVCKEYLRLFDSVGFNYRVHSLKKYEKDVKDPVSGHEPSKIMAFHLERAIYDFLHRNVDGYKGDMNLPYHFFDLKNKDFHVWEKVIMKPLNLSFNEHEWKHLDDLRNLILQSKSVSASSSISNMASSSTNNKKTKFDMVENFNRALHSILIKKYIERGSLSSDKSEETNNNNISNSSNEEPEKKLLKEVSQEIASILTLSNNDLNRLIEGQRFMRWENRAKVIQTRIKAMNPDVIGLQELDEVKELMDGLYPNLKLAVFKHRKVSFNDDGCAIFYNPERFRLRTISKNNLYRKLGGNTSEDKMEKSNDLDDQTIGNLIEDDEIPMVGFIRYSSESFLTKQIKNRLHGEKDETGELNISSNIKQSLPIYANLFPMRNGVIKPEDPKVNFPIDKAEFRWIDSYPPFQNEPNIYVPGITFNTDNLSPNAVNGFDERIAAVAVLEEIESKKSIVCVCTHLSHSQNNSVREQIRGLQIEQLHVGISKLKGLFELDNSLSGTLEQGLDNSKQKDYEVITPTIVMMDGNDAPTLSAYDGRGDKETPLYESIQKTGFVDLLGKLYPPTTYTLNRAYRIDYLLMNTGIKASRDLNNCIEQEIENGAESKKFLISSIMPPTSIRLATIDSANSSEKILCEGDMKPLYGLPLPAVGNQDEEGSDHIPIYADIFFDSE